MRGFILIAFSILFIFRSLGQSTPASGAPTTSDDGYVKPSSYTTSPAYPHATNQSFAVEAPHALSPEIIAEARANWIAARIEDLLSRDVLPVSDTLKMEIVELEDFYQAGFRLSGSGYIQFDKGSWIYLVSNSSHNNEGVGDITLAMDNEQRFYINEGHVCGGIIHFTTRERINLPDTGLFFRYFRGDEDETEWKALSVK